jgi:hypothetical protein
MKTKIAALTVACFALLAAACGSSSSEEAVSTTTTTYRTTTTLVSLTDVYVDAMRDYFPGASRSELIDLGETACDAVDEAGSVTSALINIATDPSWAGMEEAAAYTIGASIPVFCPRYTNELNLLVR